MFQKSVLVLFSPFEVQNAVHVGIFPHKYKLFSKGAHEFPKVGNIKLSYLSNDVQGLNGRICFYLSGISCNTLHSGIDSEH